MKKLYGTVLLAAFFLAGCGAATSDNCAAEDYAVVEAAVEDGIIAYTETTAAAALGSELEETPETNAAADASSVEPFEFSDSAGSSLIYTVFDQSSDSYYAEDGTRLLITQWYTPSFYLEDSEAAGWLTDWADQLDEQTMQVRLTIEDEARFAYDQHLTDSDPADFYSYAYYSDVSTGRMDEIVISLLQVGSTNTGGAHPNYVQVAYNFDMATQRQLSLVDVIYPDTAQQLLDQLLEQLDSRLSSLESNGFFSDYQDTVTAYFSNPDLTPYWYFSDSGLVIYFNCYEIAPYAAGIVKVELPYALLDGVLRPEYFPVVYDDQEGEMDLLTAADGRTALNATKDAVGESFCLGTDGAVYSVRVYSISSWLTEDTPIMGQMLFSANRLTEKEALCLTQSESAQQPEYLLTYRTAAGEERYYAADAEGLTVISMQIGK